jgi:hypothetical protein
MNRNRERSTEKGKKVACRSSKAFVAVTGICYKTLPFHCMAVKKHTGKGSIHDYYRNE